MRRTTIFATMLACLGFAAACGGDSPNEPDSACSAGQVLDIGEKCSAGGGSSFEVMSDGLGCLIESDGISRECSNKRVEKGSFVAVNVEDTSKWRIESL